MKKIQKIDQKTIKQAKLAIKNHSLMNGNICAYCGAYGETRDHIIPISFFSIGRPNTYTSHYRNNNIVKACKECNSLCSNIVFDNFWEKKKYLYDMISWRYKDLLKSQSWSDDEIDELTGTLKSYIKSCEYVKKFIIYRLENLLKPNVLE